MVERLDACPSILAVTTLARFAKSAFVRIDRLMAIYTPAGRTTKFRRSLVTFVASDRGVSTVEREIRETMIKCFTIELDDVRAATLVISVTIAAFLFRRVRLAPVEAPPRQSIGSNLLVARKAQVALCLSRKWHVAL